MRRKVRNGVFRAWFGAESVLPWESQFCVLGRYVPGNRSFGSVLLCLRIIIVIVGGRWKKDMDCCVWKLRTKQDRRTSRCRQILFACLADVLSIYKMVTL